MRALIYQALTTDAELQSLGVLPEHVMSGDVDTPTVKPWLNLRWDLTTPGIGGMDLRTLVIWIHDQPGDYDRIDRILRRIKALFSEIVGQAHEFGHVSQIRWDGDSRDLADDGHGTITRNVTHILIGTGN